MVKDSPNADLIPLVEEPPLIRLLLEVGRALMVNGAPTQRAHDTMVEMGHLLGVKAIDVVISYEGIWISLQTADFRAQGMRSFPEFGVNFKVAIAITQLCYQLREEKRSVEALQIDLDQILKEPSAPWWQGAILSGIGCSAVGQIFGGDTGAIGVVALAAFLGSGLWLNLLRPCVSLYGATFAAAAFGGTIAGLGGFLGWTETPFEAVSASMLYLVPGMPMICGFLDILFGQVSVGISRLVHMIFASLSIAIGLWFSIHLLELVFPH